MPTKERKSVVIRDAKILFRNFAGREREFNPEGDRNFSVVLDPDLAKQLLADNWRVKQLKPRGENEEGDYHLKVNLNYKKGQPPRVVMVTSSGRTDLGSDELDILDYIEIESCDMTLNGSWSDMSGGGYAAYLRSIYVNIHEDDLDREYAAIPKAGQLPDTPPWNVEED